MKYLKYILAFSFLIIAFSANSQRFTSKKRYWSGGIMLNGMNYFGDITPKANATSFDIRMTRPQLGFFATRRLYPRLSVRAALTYGTLRGDDFVSGDADSFSNDGSDPRENEKFFRAARNQHFRNRIAELSGTVIIDLIQNRGMFYRRPDKPIPYVFAGVAIGYHNPQAQAPVGVRRPLTDNNQPSGNVIGYGSYEPLSPSTPSQDLPWSADADVQPGEWVNLRDYETENHKYSNMLISIPFGIGVRYKLNDKLDIAFEAGYRWTFTDYLDDVSGKYVKHNTNTLAYYLSDRSHSASLSGDPRDGIVAAIEVAYPGEVWRYSAPNGSPLYNNEGEFPGEKRGEDGSSEFDNGPKGPFSNANDIYMVYGIHLSYIFANNVKCPKFR